MTADQRLDQLLMGAVRENISRGGGPDMGRNPMESSPSNPVSPSRAVQMMSPPRELMRATLMSPHNVPIIDITIVTRMEGTLSKEFRIQAVEIYSWVMR